MRIYFVIVAAGTLITLMTGLIGLVGYGLKAGVFPATNFPSYLENCGEADLRKPVLEEGSDDIDYIKECEARNERQIEQYKKQQAGNAVDNFALLIVSLPLFLLHFRFVYRDWHEEKKK